MIPFMLDLYNVSSTYGYHALVSAENIVQYYKVLYKISTQDTKSKDDIAKQKNLRIVLSKIFGSKFDYLLNSNVNISQKFKENI